MKASKATCPRLPVLQALLAHWRLSNKEKFHCFILLKGSEFLMSHMCTYSTVHLKGKFGPAEHVG